MLDIQHLSKDQNDHYIKRIEVQKDNEPMQVMTPRQQVQPTGMTADFDYVAKEGDTFFIKAYCSKGGTQTLEFQITKELLNEPIVPRKEPDEAAAVHPKDSTKFKPAVDLDEDVAVPAVTTDPDKIKPAVSYDPDVIKPANSVGLDPYSSKNSTSSGK